MVAVAALAGQCRRAGSSPFAALELADGVALSWTSFCRTTSCSPSSGVVNSPPSTGSQNQSSIVSAVAPSRLDPACFAGQLGEPDECLDERGVVGRQRPMAGTRIAVRMPGPEPAAVIVAELAKQELATRHGGRLPVVAAECRRRIGERSEEQAFHSVSTLSSSPGGGRCDPTTSSRRRASFMPASPSELAAGVQTVRNRSSLEIAVVRDTPPLDRRVDRLASSIPARASRNSAGVQVWNKPSTP